MHDRCASKYPPQRSRCGFIAVRGHSVIVAPDQPYDGPSKNINCRYDEHDTLRVASVIVC
jgi:hypothetical protein